MWRIEHRSTFEALRRARRRRQGPLSVAWVPGAAGEPPRVGFSVGRRVGGAVDRNRLRRRLRSAMRDAGCRLHPGSYLIRVEPPARQLSYTELHQILRQALEGLHRS